MIIKTLWGKPKNEKLGVEILVAWDENSIDQNSEGYELEVVLAQQENDDVYKAFREIDIFVPDTVIEWVFETPQVNGTVKVK
jgi:hypothetical protein